MKRGRIVAMQMDRDGTELILNLNAARAGGGRLFMSLNRGQVAKCVDEFVAGVKISDDFWGMPVKTICDPDGNDLLFYDDDLAETKIQYPKMHLPLFSKEGEVGFIPGVSYFRF